MLKLLQTKSFLLLMGLMLGVGSVSAQTETATISFSNATDATAINKASVTGDDSQGNTWTITTEGTTSFTANSDYYQVGSSKKPATSITFTTTLANDVNITAFSAKFGGFSGTAGTVTLKVGDNTVGTGSLNEANDVTVSSTTVADGRVLTVTVTGISKGVKCYNISYTYSTAPRPTHTASFNVDGTVTTAEFQEGAAIVFPADPQNIDGKSFMGWSTSAIDGTQTNAPTFVSSATMGTADVTYYAVFATAQGTETNEEITIDSQTENFPTAYGTANTFTEYTLEGVKFKIQQGYINGSKLQWRAAGNNSGTGTMYNTDALNKIQSIVLTYESGDSNKNFTVNVGNEANPTSGSSITPTANGNVYTFDCSASNYNYFVMTNGSGAGYLTSIAITYKVGDTSYSDYCTTVTPATATITLNAACNDGTLVYGTYSNTSAFVVSDDIEVSEVAIVDGKLYIESYKSGDVVPANTGVMVSALEGGDYTVTLTDAEGESVLGDDNCLRPSGEGITAEGMAQAAANCKYYRLTMQGGTQIGFWWGAADGAAFALAANKAYLAVPTSVGGSRTGFTFAGNETGIESVNTVSTADSYFDLQGRRVMQPTRGLYIVNGKKVVLK